MTSIIENQLYNFLGVEDLDWSLLNNFLESYPYYHFFFFKMIKEKSLKDNLIEKLIDNNVLSFDLVSNGNETLLMTCLYHGYNETIIKKLLEKTNNLNLINNNKTALDLLLEKHFLYSLDLISAFLEKNAISHHYNQEKLFLQSNLSSFIKKTQILKNLDLN